MSDPWKSSRWCIVDRGGMFVSWALRLAREVGEVFYHNPAWKTLSPKSKELLVGYGFDEITLVKNFWDVKDQMDCFVFPTVGDGDWQLELVRQGKRVWGSRKGEELELYRAESKEEFRKLGMPVGKYDVVAGLPALRQYLKKHPNVHVKVNLTRGDCFDAETEVLTKRGWVRFPELSRDDKVISMDLKSLKTRWVSPTAYHSYFHDGTMLQISGRQCSVDALVTPNHHFWAKTQHQSPMKYKTANELYGKQFHVPQRMQHSGLSQRVFVLKNAFGDQSVKEDRKLSMLDWAEFLGWFVSEGCITKTKRNSHRVGISQSLSGNQEKYRLIENLLLRMGFNVQYETDKGFSVYDKSLFVELAKTCYVGDGGCAVCGHRFCSHRKKVPDYLKRQSKEIISVFLRSYALGDGCQESRRYGQLKYYTSSKRLADDVQELVFYSGGCASIRTCSKAGDLGGENRRGVQIVSRCDSYSVNVFGERENATVGPANMKWVDYTGWVYDITVEPWHSLFVRRNGKAYWSGNSETFKSPSYDEVRSRLRAMDHDLDDAGDIMEFICENPIEPAIEIGIDTHTVDGQFPKFSINGVEEKDKSYSGVFLPYDQLDESVRKVNDWLAPALADYRYRGWFSTEIRVGPDEQPYLIDPTCRAPSPPSECMQEAISNWGEIIWHGSEGVMVDPEPVAKYSSGAIIYCDHADEECVTVKIPDEIRNFVKLYFHARINGQDKFLPQPAKFSQIGWVVGLGESLSEANKQTEEHAEQISGDKIHVQTEGLEKVLEAIKEGERMGVKFSDEPVKG